MKKAFLILALLLPMMLSAQLLMLINHPLQPSGGPGGVSYANDVTYFFGDSVTEGYLLASTSNRFSTLLSKQFSLIETNLGADGSQITDAGESDQITAHNAIFETNISVWLAGYNDMRYFGTNAAALTDNMSALEFLAAWLAIPTSQRVPYDYTNNLSNGGIFYSSGWTFNSSVLGGLAFSSAAGNHAAFFFSGTTLLIGTARGGNGGDVSVVVDGAVTNTYSCMRTAAPTGEGRGYSAGLIVITNLPFATNHLAVFTAQSAGNTFLCWYAGYATNLSPKVVLCGTLRMSTMGYAAGPPYTNGSNFAVDQYSGMISNVASVLSGAKLNVQWVPAPNLDTNTDWEFDWVHPNENGHLRIKNSLQNAF